MMFLKTAQKRHWKGPTSGNCGNKDVDRRERQENSTKKTLAAVNVRESRNLHKNDGICYNAPKMKVLLNFSNVKDVDLAFKFKGIGGEMKTNIRLFPKTPVDLDDFLALVDEYHHAIAAAMDGGKKAIAQRKNLRRQAIKMATHLGHYVEDVSGDDLGTVYAAGFEPAYKYRLLAKPLPKTAVNKVVLGPTTGTALAYIVPISRSNGKVTYYELGYVEENGNETGELTKIIAHVARFPILVENLSPGTRYVFQARAINRFGFNDWSDPVSFMAT